MWYFIELRLLRTFVVTGKGRREGRVSKGTEATLGEKREYKRREEKRKSGKE
jgi:hypothetical protein